MEIGKFIISFRDRHLREMDRSVNNYRSRLANCGPRAKSGPSPVFGKFYWIIAILIYLFCFCATTEELNSCNKLYGLQNLKYLLSGPSQKKFTSL